MFEVVSKRLALCLLLSLRFLGEFIVRKIKLLVYIPACTQPAIFTFKISLIKQDSVKHLGMNLV